MPIKGVILVTHNIEEAVLMCDRILVFGSNPGRILSEIKVTLPQPRNRLDPSFRELVEKHLRGNDGAAQGRRSRRKARALSRARHRQRAAACRIQCDLRPDGGGGGLTLQRQGGPAGNRIRSSPWRSMNCSRWRKPCRCCALPNSKAAISNSPTTAWPLPTRISTSANGYFMRHLLGLRAAGRAHPPGAG